MRMRGQPVVCVLMIVGMTVMLMIMTGLGHRVLLPEERSVTILAVNSWANRWTTSNDTATKSVS